MELTSYITRMQDEHRDLCFKINALRGFLLNPEKTSSSEEATAMKKQLQAMQSYESILQQRINHATAQRYYKGQTG